ncbi:MAG: radical SAM protein [Neisseriaceae bacterium]|nr:MAG: radical SAM protein [Neisseriaceae bacterium]
MKNNILTFSDHSRHFKDCIYVYPVVSRRSQGVSLGINLNINNACNWRCVYCQVEGLVRGKPERIDLSRLKFELDIMLDWIVNGKFIQEYAPVGLQRFNDICLSGNGESTLSEDFVAVCQIIAELRKKYAVGSDVKTVLISNGSEILKESVQQGLTIISENNGELWFKIDRANHDAINLVNQVSIDLNGVIKRLKLASSLCTTYVQSCWFRVDEIEPAAELAAEFVDLMVQLKPYIAGVLLYSTARNPALPEGNNISQVSPEFLANLADQIARSGIIVKNYV